MRGTPKGAATAQGGHEIIPAYAGNTEAARNRCADSGDHPRVCGEHYLLSIVLTVISGSSPRMRGTHTAPLHTRGNAGIIPAYAGNTVVA